MNLALSIFLALSLAAQTHLWTASIVALGATSAADYATSWGQWEGNRLLRGPDGRFSPARGAAWKIGPTTAMLVAQVKMPRARKAWTIANFCLAGFYGVVAIRNARIRR